MFNKRDARSGIYFVKDFVNDQTLTNVTKKNNIANIGFSASLGIGSDNGGSAVAIMHVGGFNDQRATAVMRYTPPTAIGGEDIGVMLRLRSFDSPAIDYYYARCNAGLAKISRISSGTFTTLSSTPFALSQSQDVTITFSVVGSVLSASFSATGGSPATVNLTAVDTIIPGGGLIAIRSQTSSIFCKSITIEQL